MFRVDMLPAAHGDCLWIEYGDPDDPRRVLIDAGPPNTSTYQVLIDRIRALPKEHRMFELFVITHVDADHIGGSIRLLRDAQALGLRFNRIWFNGHEQLSSIPAVRSFLGAAQGEYLSLLIDDYEKRTGTQVLNVGVADSWVGVADVTRPAVVELPGGLKLTILGPTTEQLISLAIEWKKVVDELGFRSDAGPLATIREQLEASSQLRPLLTDETQVHQLGDEDEDELPEVPATFGISVLGSEVALGSDASPANGSSIALLAEHADGSALLSGDAFASVLAASLQSVLAERGKDRLRVGALKVAHHGSSGNVSEELLNTLSTKHYLISTSGAQFGHPHASAIDALLEFHDSARGKPELWFNHHSVTTEPWKSKAEQKRLGIVSHYPAGGISWSD